MTVSIDTVKPALMSQKATINDFKKDKIAEAIKTLHK